MKQRNLNVTFLAVIYLLVIVGFSLNGAVGFSDVKGGTNTGKSTNNYTENNISASAAGNWEFRSATASPSAHKDASFTASSASTSTKSGIYFNYVNFTVVMSGTIVPVGPGSGPPPPTDYTLSISNPTTSYSVEPTEAIIATGGSITFYSKVDMDISDPTYKVSDWSFIPSSYEVNGESTTVQGKLGVTSATVGSAGWPTPDAGLYSIRCMPSPSAEANPPSATANLHVVEITKPAKNGSASKWETGSYRYDCQAVESGTSGSYNLGITGNWASRADGQWSLSAVKGTIASATSSSTTYSPPSTSGSVDLRLKFTATGDNILDTRTITIFEDHLARDYYNFGTNRSCASGWKPLDYYSVASNDLPVMSTWNCHGSTLHAYNNSGSGSSSTVVQPGWTLINTVTQTTQGQSVNLGTLQRGYVVVYYDTNGILMHSQTVTGGTTTYGANNEQLPSPGTPATQSWKWYTCSAGSWTKNIYAAYLPITIKVYSP